MERAVDRQLDEFTGDGHCEFISAYAQPFAMLVVADVLGVPEEDHQTFRQFFGLATTPGGSRRRPPRRAEATASRSTCSTRSTVGSPPTSRTAGARPATTCSPTSPWPSTPTERPRRGRGGAHGHLPLRRRPGDHRPPARHRAQVPRRGSRPPEPAPGRPGAHPRLHRGGVADREPGQGRLPTGPPVGHRRRGRHRTGNARHAVERGSQPGPPAVRVPGRVSGRPTERQGARRLRARHPFVSGRAFGPGRGPDQYRAHPGPVGDIRLSEEHHGPPGARRFAYEPTWVLRGLHDLHIEFTAMEAPK